MPTPLGARNIFDGTAVPVTSSFKATMGNLRDYLAALLGTTGAAIDARTALGLGVTDVPIFSGLNGGQLAGFRSKTINGGCQIAQRGNVAGVLNTWTYGGCDRIAVLIGGTTASGTIQQYTGAATVTGFAQGVQATTTGAGVVSFQQRAKASNTKPWNSKQVTVSALVYQNTGGALNCVGTLAKPTTTADTFSAQTTLATGSVTSVPSGTVTRLSVTYTLGAAEASLGLAFGASFTAVGAVTAKDFWISELQIEPGAVITPLEDRGDLELILCQHYYRIVSFGTRFPAAAGSAVYRATVSFPDMRVVPGSLELAAGSTLNLGGRTYTVNGISTLSQELTSAAAGDTYAIGSLVALGAEL